MYIFIENMEQGHLVEQIKKPILSYDEAFASSISSKYQEDWEIPKRDR